MRAQVVGGDEDMSDYTAGKECVCSGRSRRCSHMLTHLDMTKRDRCIRSFLFPLDLPRAFPTKVLH
jgi:hypothetical protein